MEVILIDIYIKPVKKASIIKKRNVNLRDVAEVYAPANLKTKVESVNVMNIKEEIKKIYLLSAIDIIKSVNKEFPECSINIVGEIDTIVQYEPAAPKTNKIWTFTKIAFIVIVLFAGAATAIMSFHTDAQIPQVLENYYYIFFGEQVTRPLIIEIPYSIGLAVGIISFYNHIFKWHITDDPTPLEVEMTTYEQDVDACVMDNLSGEKRSDQ